MIQSMLKSVFDRRPHNIRGLLLRLFLITVSGIIDFVFVLVLFLLFVRIFAQNFHGHFLKECVYFLEEAMKTDGRLIKLERYYLSNG